MDKLVFIDFETYWDQEYSLTKMSTEDYIMDERFEVQGLAIIAHDPLTEVNENYFIQGPDKCGKAIMLLPWERWAVCAHNALFDVGILKMRFGKMPKFIMDTMSMANAYVKPFTGRVGLHACAEYYGLEGKRFNLFNTKGMRFNQMTEGQKDDLKEYGMHDVRICRDIFQKMCGEDFPKSELEVIDHTLRMYLEPKLELDETRLEFLLKEEDQKIEDLLQAACVSDPSTLRSDKVFAATLRLMGVDPPTKISPTTGKETWAFARSDLAFQNLATSEDSSEAVRNLCLARMGVKSTIGKTRAERFLSIAKKRKKFRVPLGYYRAHTGRYGGTEKINVQNLPRGSGLRESIIAPGGHVVLAVDASQIEARILAWWAEQENLIRQFRSGMDVYSIFASKLYNVPVDKDRYPDERFVGKTAILGLGYGLGHEKFHTVCQHKGIKMSNRDARRTVMMYREEYYNINQLWRDANNLLEDHVDCQWDDPIAKGPVVFRKERIELPNGMAIHYPKIRMGEDGNLVYGEGRFERRIYGPKVVENVVQALARIVTFDAMMELKKQGLPACMQVHDELIFVVKESEAEDALKLAIELMSKPTKSWAAGIPLAAEGGYGATYATAK